MSNKAVTTINGRPFLPMLSPWRRFRKINIEQQLLSGRTLKITAFYAHSLIDTIVGV
jgi:hypothetical protein